MGARHVGTDVLLTPENTRYNRVIDIEGWPLFYRDDAYLDRYVAENIKDEDGETGKIEIIWDEEYYVF